MSMIDTIRIQHFHEARIQDYGIDSVEALGWKNRHSQRVRFSMLEDIGDLNHCSVLDVGCGHGDLRIYLNDRYPYLRYVGIDQEDNFLKVAIEKCCHLPDTSFFHGDCYEAALPRLDYVLASGSLIYHHSDPAFIQKIILKLFITCRIAFGFNLLSSAPPGGILAAYDPAVILDYCHTLTSRVIAHQGYLKDDFTIWMYK